MLATLATPVVLDNGFVLLAVVSLILGLVYRAYSPTGFSDDLSLIREAPGKKHFSIWTRISFYFNCASLYRDVYDKFSKRGKPVLVPTLGTRKEIFLPYSSMKWALSQPPSVLGMWEAFNEMFQLGHSLGDEKYMIDTWPHLLARHVLTQELDEYILAVHEELKHAVDTRFGTDTENWTTLDLLDTIRMVVNQVGSRFAVGLPLCRDEEYLRLLMSAIDGIVETAGVTGFAPTFLRPLVGSLTSSRTRGRLAKLEAKYDPIFKERIRIMQSEKPEASEPTDLLQKMMRYAQENRPDELETSQMTKRLLMANLGFIYQPNFAMSNMILNIVNSDAEYGTISTLREEAATHLLIFGRGRNSCPGRFLVDFQLKMMVSHLLTNYDLKFPDEYQGQRPPNRWLLEFIFPPRLVKVMVKRRAAV
ncbi:hypothetical protein V8E54_002681 [Elaphomyces granulatus]